MLVAGGTVVVVDGRVLDASAVVVGSADDELVASAPADARSASSAPAEPSNKPALATQATSPGPAAAVYAAARRDLNCGVMIPILRAARR